ncbi:MAG TPA: hypothetical protein VES42_00585 [Pilimelia sp.]|nr:hypothetical protein [Pilimelia sp.]
MSRHRRAALTLVAIAAGFLTASPAAADPGTPVPIPSWVGAHCAAAELTGIRYNAPDAVFVAFGTATQCGTPVPDAGFRVATYTAAASVGTSPGHAARLFPAKAPLAAVPFGAAVLPPAAGRYGVCVLAGQWKRLTCVAADVTADLQISVAPLPTDDALVAKVVHARPFGAWPPPGEEINGTCGTCF